MEKSDGIIKPKKLQIEKDTPRKCPSKNKHSSKRQKVKETGHRHLGVYKRESPEGERTILHEKKKESRRGKK